MSQARRPDLALACFALALAALAAPAAAEAPAWLTPKAAYMADTVMESDGRRMTGRVWASGPMERREISMDGQTHTVILRKDRGLSWILMPEQRLYLEQPLGAGATAADRFAGAGHLEREALGQETVNGVPATRYRVRGTAFDGEPFAGELWMTEHEIPVRVVTGEGAERVRMELDRLSVGAIDPGRFEIPPGWKRFELPAPAQADLDALREHYGR